MLHNNYEIRVLVKGRPINEYPHNGKVFIEGRDSSNFEIEFINRTSTRVEAVIAVDGLSVIDGKDAGPASSGYLVNGYETVRIPGWKLTDEQVAAFVFAGKKASYAQQSTGSARNTGVIGAMVFAEKPKVNAYRPSYGGVTLSGYAGGGVMRGMLPTSGGWVGTDSTGDPIIGATINQMSMVSDNLSYSSNPHNMVFTSATASVAPDTRARSKGLSGRNVTRAKMSSTPMPEVVEQTLGTGFGEATEFATHSVEFDRGELTAMIVLYYDDSRGLRARGIELNRSPRRRVERADAPQAFPGMNTGCAPPPGWKG